MFKYAVMIGDDVFLKKAVFEALDILDEEDESFYLYDVHKCSVCGKGLGTV